VTIFGVEHAAHFATGLAPTVQATPTADPDPPATRCTSDRPTPQGSHPASCVVGREPGQSPSAWIKNPKGRDRDSLLVRGSDSEARLVAL